MGQAARGIALRASVAMGSAHHIPIAADRVDVITQHLTTELQQPALAKGVAHDRFLGLEVVASTTRDIAFLLGPDILLRQFLQSPPFIQALA